MQSGISSSTELAPVHIKRRAQHARGRSEQARKSEQDGEDESLPGESMPSQVQAALRLDSLEADTGRPLQDTSNSSVH